MLILGPLHAKRAAIIYNPVARTISRRKYLLQRSIEELARQGIEATLIATRAPGTAVEQTRQEIENGCDLIIAAGGDGTINEVANGMLHTNVPLAILPGGTANVLAREMRMPRRLEDAVARIRQFRPVRVAAGSLKTESEERIFLCMAGAGLDAEIVSRIDGNLKASIGKFAYYLVSFGQVVRPLPEFEVSVDGRSYQASFALVTRVRNYGGDLEIARGASLLRNQFDVVLFRGTRSVRYLSYLLGVVVGRPNQISGCEVLRASSVVCRDPLARRVFVQIDGELAGQLPCSMQIMPDALTILAPPEYLAREQSLVAVPACA
jgi:YegS/Rv2252/BmrU family lipid kinase